MIWTTFAKPFFFKEAWKLETIKETLFVLNPKGHSGRGDFREQCLWNQLTQLACYIKEYH